MLDEPPRLVHDAQLERGGFGRILDTGRDAMQHVEEQRLQDYRKSPHCLEIEHLKSLDGNRVFEVVEEPRVTPAFDPLCAAARESPREQVRNGE
jgi:hypothetical protein